jgi:hypothetical protein
VSPRQAERLPLLERAGLFAGAVAHAARLFDPAVAAEPAPSGDDAALAVMHGLYWLSLNLAERAPLVIVVDDLQWADAASTRWLAYLARRLELVAAAVLAGVRPVEDEDPVLIELLADPSTLLVRPSALSETAVGEIVRAQLGEADEAFVLACHRTTGGNPLLVQELVRTLADEAIPPTAGSVVVVERTAPDAVARSVTLRLRRLADPAPALARAIAILGDDTDGRTAAALAGIERRERAPTAAALARVNLLHSDPPLRFVHPVVRNAVYEGIEPHARGEEHARAAQLLAAAGEPSERVAAQLLLEADLFANATRVAPPPPIHPGARWRRSPTTGSATTRRPASWPLRSCGLRGVGAHRERLAARSASAACWNAAPAGRAAYARPLRSWTTVAD